MKFSSYGEIVQNYIFLKRVVEELEESYFLYMTREEIKSEKESIIDELRVDASFKLLAKFEADIRTDYNRRIKAGKKDNLSEKYMDLCLKFRSLCKEYDKPLEKLCRRMPFDNILEGLKDYFKDTGDLLHQECSNIKGSLHFRHWYAHGRYFKHRVPVPDPDILEIICKDIIDRILAK